MRYAEVCVNTPLGSPTPSSAVGDDQQGRTFTYAVPDRLASRLQPGHLVWAPFRGRRLQGVVLRISDAAPKFDVREIISLVWAQPLLTPAQLALAHWISNTYLAPLIEALRLMLPAGLTQRGRTVFVHVGGVAPAGLTSRQIALLERLTARAGDWSEISQGLRGVTQRDDLAPLIEMGLVTQEVEFPAPPPRPKTDRQVRLLADADAIARALPFLGHASKQAEVLAWLGQGAGVGRQGDPADRAADGPKPMVALDQVRAAVGCTDAPVKALAARGWVEIVRGKTGAASGSAGGAPAQVRLLLSPDATTEAIIELPRERETPRRARRADGPRGTRLDRLGVRRDRRDTRNSA